MFKINFLIACTRLQAVIFPQVLYAGFRKNMLIGAYVVMFHLNKTSSVCPMINFVTSSCTAARFSV